MMKSQHPIIKVLVFLMLLVGFRPEAIKSQTPNVSIELGLEQPIVNMELSPLAGQDSLDEYSRLSETIGILDEEKLVIMVWKISNLVDIPVETSLGEAVPITGANRHMVVAYLGEDSQTGRPTYTLPKWDTILRVPPKESITLRMVFIVEHGEHAVFEKSLRILACFSHELLYGVYHSLAWSSLTQKASKPLEELPPGELTKEGTIQHPPIGGFDICQNVTPEAVRSLSFPMTPLSSGGPSKYVESFLGARGKDNTYPYWFDICLAAADGQFDYSTAVRYLHLISVYKSTYLSGLARNAVWLRDQGVLLTPTAHRVYLASSVWGVCTLPHAAAEVILYVASEALTIGLDPTYLAPIPGTYKPRPDKGHSFELRLSGVSIKAQSTGVGYQIEISKPDEAQNEVWTQSLVYSRKTAAE